MKGIFNVLKRSLTKFMDDKCMVWAAAIAYYAMLSIFPLVLGAMAVASLIVNDPKTRKDLTSNLQGWLKDQNISGINIVDIVNGFVDSLSQAAPLLAAFSILSALWSGSGIFDQIMSAVNEAWDVRKDGRSFFIKVGLRFLMMFFLGTLLIASFAVSFMVELIKNLELFGFSPKSLPFVFDLAAYLIPLALTTFIFAVIFWLSPDRKHSANRHQMLWGPVFMGALFAALLFEAAKFGLTLYITSFGGASGYAKTYGAIAGVVIFLFYIYVSACILLLGAEVAAEASLAKEHQLDLARLPQKAGQILPAEPEPEGAVAVSGEILVGSEEATSRNNPLALFVGLITIGIMWLYGLWRFRSKAS